MTTERTTSKETKLFKRRTVLASLTAVAIALTAAAFSGTATNASDETAKPPSAGKEREVAIFAGGCFWCVESDFDKVPGVISTTSGYTGGALKNPTYKQVSYTETGHYEAVKIVYDPKKVTYKELVDRFFRSVDPTDDGGQFCDRGTSYKTAIFATSPEQKKIAEDVKQAFAKSGILKSPIVTPVKTASKFWRGEKYHQNYYKKNPIRYKYYRYGCGRDNRLQALWGDKAWTAK